MQPRVLVAFLTSYWIWSLVDGHFPDSRRNIAFRFELFFKPITSKVWDKFSVFTVSRPKHRQYCLSATAFCMLKLVLMLTVWPTMNSSTSFNVVFLLKYASLVSLGTDPSSYMTPNFIKTSSSSNSLTTLP